MALPKIVVIVGPTASGKSALGVMLAKKFRGEVVSADSRQIYRGMDIGTGKVTKKEMAGIRHQLLDIADPEENFSVQQYQKKAFEAIKEILKRKKLPIIVGGTGFYIQAVVDNIVFPQVPPDPSLRRKLEGKTAEELYGILKLFDPGRAKTIDKNNRRRLIRAIEIAMQTKRPLIPLQKGGPIFEPLIIGIKLEKGELKKLITKRFREWLRRGFLKEIQRLQKKGVPEKRLEEFGLHYRQALRYLKADVSVGSPTSRRGKQITKKEFETLSQKALFDYARRQFVWFKRDKRIRWIQTEVEAVKLVRGFLSQ